MLNRQQARSRSETKAAQPGVLPQCGGVRWGRAWEGGSRGKGHVYLWHHIDVQQKPTQHCKATILQLKVNFKNTTGYVPANNC